MKKICAIVYQKQICFEIDLNFEKTHLEIKDEFEDMVQQFKNTDEAQTKTKPN